MDETQERLQGTVQAVTFQNEENGFAVLTLCDQDGDLVSVVGPLAGAAPGEDLTLLGKYTNHASYGRQFEAVACTYRMPESEDAILQYLSSGVLPGIGLAIAKRMVQKYGDQALEILASTPERMAEVQGFTLAKAREAGRRFNELFGVREAVTSMAALGLTAAEALAVYREYGAQALPMVSRNPFVLCSAPFFMPFFRADEIAKRLTIEPESDDRVRAILLYTLRRNLNNGHTCLPRHKLVQVTSAHFRVEPERLQQQLEELAEVGEIEIVAYDDIEYVYLSELYAAEVGAALRIKQLAAIPPAAKSGIKDKIKAREAEEGIRYAPQQKQAIEEALRRHVVVVTGGPGTGKTTAVNAILALYEQQAERVMLAAPTGRAAKRMTELTGRKAATIHRMLEAKYAPGSNTPRFGRNAKNPLRCDVLVVDEMSMVDAMLFENLLAALRPGCRLVMVGDADQLPSVGCGNVLRGIIDSGAVPVVVLDKVFRQAAASLIVSNAHRIVQGLMPEAGGKRDDYFFMKAYGTHCRRLVCDLVSQRLPAAYGYSPQEDIQVLCPSHKGLVGTQVLNAELQELLNPPASDKPELRRGDVRFRKGDKVMQVKNNYDIPYTRTDGEPGAGAFNGDIGIIEEVQPKQGSLTVLCEDRHVYYTQENLHELEMAYAITIHKSQGSEFEAVVIPLESTPDQLQYRNLLYTAVTRAKRLCILTGDNEILARMVRNGRRNKRYSCFARFLKDEALV